MLRWRVNPLEELRSAGWYPRKIRLAKLFGEATVQKMRRDQLLSWAEFDRLCRVLGKQPGDLIEWVPDNSEPQEEVQEEPDTSWWYKPNYEDSGNEG